jgi:hypothetical protein
MLKNTFSYDKETGKNMWNEKRRKDIGCVDSRKWKGE